MTINKQDFLSGVCEKYPEELLQNRLTVEGNTIGCIAGNILLMDDSMLKTTDYITKDGRFLFGLLKQLRDKGFSYIDEVTVLSNTTEEIQERLEEIGGWKSIQHLIDVCDERNFDIFLDNLNKSNICLRLCENGWDLINKVKLNNGKEITPYKLFDKFNSQEVLDYYEEKLSVLGTASSSKIIEESCIDFDDAFISKLESGETAGTSFATAGVDIHGEDINTFPFLSNNILGLKHGTLSAFSGFSGAGKSTFMIGIILSLISQGEKVLVVNNEMSVDDFKVSFLVWILYRVFDYGKLTKKKLVSGNLDAEDKAMIKKARKYWKENYADSVKMVALSDADAGLTCRLIKKYIQRDGVTAFLVDTFKLTTTNGKDNQFWLDLIVDSKNLDAISKRFSVIGMMTIQLALNSLGRLWLDSSCLSQSKAVKEVLSNLIMLRPVYQEELTKGSSVYINPFRHKKDDKGEWYEEEYLPDPTKTYRCLFLDKSRSGECSGDNGICYLLRFDGNHATFWETSKCRPSHKVMNI